MSEQEVNVDYLLKALQEQVAQSAVNTVGLQALVRSKEDQITQLQAEVEKLTTKYDELEQKSSTPVKE